MNKLLIDSGATKTDYLLLSVRGEALFRFKNRGINISYVTDGELYAVLQECKGELPPNNMPEQIIFYGAGCGKDFNAERVSIALSHLFPDTLVTVYSDLMGACHALCGANQGWVAILGTGSGSCFYDGEKIVAMPPSLGYMLGDEGSGTHLGKLLLTSYLEKKLPSPLHQQLEHQYSISVPIVMEELYRKPFPNKFMSAFAPFMLSNIENPHILSLCENSFSSFIRKQLDLLAPDFYPENLHLTGSIAFYFQHVIKNVAKKMGVSVTKVVPAPIEGLMTYYNDIAK